MHKANRTVGGLDIQRERHACERRAPAPVLGAGNAASHDQYAGGEIISPALRDADTQLIAVRARIRRIGGIPDGVSNTSL